MRIFPIILFFYQTRVKAGILKTLLNPKIVVLFTRFGMKDMERLERTTIKMIF